MAKGNSNQTSVVDQLETMRKEVERLLGPQLPIAFSTDGRTFGYEAALSLPLAVGSYVTIRTPAGKEYIGQILTQTISERLGPEYGVKFNVETGGLMIGKASRDSQFTDRLRLRYINGTGTVLRRLEDKSVVRTTDKDHFEKSTLSVASKEAVTLYLHQKSASIASLDIGSALYVNDYVPVPLDAGAFNRHTFLCGQSGSGKTFALGVVIEQLLMETQLRIIIIDPNSDFVNLAKLRDCSEINKTRAHALSPSDYDVLSAQWHTNTYSRIQVLRSTDFMEGNSVPLKINFSDLESNEQAILLRMHPLEQMNEFSNFQRILQKIGAPFYCTLSEVVDALDREGDPKLTFGAPSELARVTAQRIANLEIDKWKSWCKPGEMSSMNLLRQNDWRCMVIDIGSLHSVEQKSVISMAVLNHFWRNRNDKNPVLIVIVSSQ